MDGNDRAALRDAPAWDRWQDVRMPVTIDEANAAILLVCMKRDVLESAASLDPERESELQFAADRWAELLVKLEWAREVLRSGESVDARKYRELKERHDALIRLATECPDTRTLIDTLLLRIQRANQRLDEWRTDRNIASAGYEDMKRRHAERVASLTATLAEKQATLDEQGATIHALRNEVARFRALPAPLPEEMRASYVRSLHRNAAGAVFVIDELRASGGTCSPVGAYLADNLHKGLPAGFYDAWIADEMPNVKAAMERKAARSNEETR